MSTSERKNQRTSRRFPCALALALAAACGGTVNRTPSVGSESHFLAYCDASCPVGLDCIGGICTRSCLAEQSSCADLAAAASCTNQSVEPGQVAVCDVGCQGNAECSSLGSDYECIGSFCRRPNEPALGGNGSAGSGSITPDPTCRGVGRYQVGKEGGYLPCCAGLTELSTLLEASDANGNRTCEQFPLNSYSCITGSCGDGICSEGEAPCGCGVDCPDSNWRASEASCEPFRDQSPPPDVRVISITNTGSVPLYILPYRSGCLLPTSLLSVTRGGELVDVTPPASCQHSCQSLLDEGWPYLPGQAAPACPNVNCPEPNAVFLAPGETRQETVALEIVPQQLPRSCAVGLTSDTTACYTRVIPQPGNYTLTVQAALLDCPVGADCFCAPDATGACQNPIPLAEPIRFEFPSTWYFQNHELAIAAPASAN